MGRPGPGPDIDLEDDVVDAVNVVRSPPAGQPLPGRALGQ